MVAAGMVTSTEEFATFLASYMIVPDISLKRPGTLAKKCRTWKPATEWLLSMLNFSASASDGAANATSSAAAAMSVRKCFTGEAPFECGGVRPECWEQTRGAFVGARTLATRSTHGNHVHELGRLNPDKCALEHEFFAPP